MSSTPQATLAEWSRASWALTAFAVAAERGVLAALAAGPCAIAELAVRANLHVATVRAIADVLAAGGFVERDGDEVRASEAFRPALQGRGSEFVAADVRSTVGQLAATVMRARDAAAAIEGWSAEDPVIVRAQGATSEQITAGMKPFFEKVPPLLAALSADGARFLDVGAGAAGLCVALARMFPKLHVVGIEPSSVAIGEARRVVADAGLTERVELRQGFGQAVADEQAFDVAYVAQMFMPDDVIADVMSAAFRALRPGGFVFTGAIAARGSELGACVSRWRSAVWGAGAERDADALSTILGKAGFADVKAFPMPPGSTMVPFLARRP